MVILFTAAMGGMFVVGAASNIVRIYLANMIGERITSRLRQNTYESILDQELAFYDKSRTGELVSRLSSGRWH